MSKPGIELEEQKKIDIEFLLRLYFHFYKLDIIIKGSLNMGKIWDCYFINKNIIEKYKNFYEYNQLEDLINTPEIKLIIDEAFEVIKEMLIDGNYIVVQGFGVFFTDYLDEANIKDPRNSDIIHYEKRRVPRFYFSRNLKKQLKNFDKKK